MKRHLVRLLLAVLLASTAIAAKPVNGGFGCFGPTVTFIDASGLNAAFAPHGMTELGSLQWGFGGAGYALIDRIVIGGSGWGSSQTVASDSLRARVSISGGEFDLGYSLISIPHLIVAPVLGIGGDGYTIELQNLTGDVPNFGQLLLKPGRTSTVSFSSFSLAPQLMVVVPVSFVGLQIRGGYAYLPMTPEWELADGGKLLNGPTVGKGMPFASLNVVFGGFESDSRRHKVKK